MGGVVFVKETSCVHLSLRIFPHGDTQARCTHLDCVLIRVETLDVQLHVFVVLCGWWCSVEDKPEVVFKNLATKKKTKQKNLSGERPLAPTHPRLQIPPLPPSP